MPAPRPRFEIFVYSPRVEGVHLRYGPVARGGLRWRTGPQDFRTEILGLVKAQAVKNAVIVPVGAKGGFVVRRPEAGPRRGRGLLPDVHLRAARRHRQPRHRPDGRAETVPPPDVVRHDGDDAYLVVAADKGTAKFSDIANEVAASYGFWLGDAFASGGSMGYDHKAMGITARGAWESVKRHFRELGVDTQTEEFTVVGIGDMSGDVFGNGMLLSPHIRLVAAFDHRHVFVDPTPDAARGLRRAASGCSRCPARRGTTTTATRSARAAGCGRGRRSRCRSGRRSAPRSGSPRRSTRLSPPELIRGDPAGPGRPAVERRDRHLRQGDRGVARRRRGQGQRRDPRRRRASCASRSSARAATSGSPSGAGSSSPATAGRSTPMRSTTPRASTAPTTRSTSRSCSTGWSRTARLDREARNALLVEMTDDVAELVLADNRDAERRAGRRPGARARHDADVHAAARRRPRGPPRHRPAAGGAAGHGRVRRAGGGGAGADRAPSWRPCSRTRSSTCTPACSPRTCPTRRRSRAGCPSTSRAALRERFPDAIADHPLRREILTTLLVNEIVDAAGMTYAFRWKTSWAPARTTRCGRSRSSPRCSTCPSCGSACRVPADPHRGLGRDGARVAAAARPRRRGGSSRTGRSRWPSARPSPASPHRSRALRPTAAGAAVGPGVRRDDGRRGEAADRRRAARAGRWRPRRCWTSYGLLDIVELAELAEREKEPREPFEVAQLYYAHVRAPRDHVALTAVSGLERGDRWHALARLALRDDLYGSLRAVTLDALREAAPGTPVDEAIAQWERANASRLLRARAGAGRDPGRPPAGPGDAVGGVAAAARPGAVSRASAGAVTDPATTRPPRTPCGAAAPRRIKMRGCAACPASSRRSRCGGPTRTPTGTSTTPRP